MTKNSLPFVTVGIIAKNEAKYIEETATSILESNYPNDKFELVVVDGNSTDGTQQIITQLAKKYDNVELVIEPHTEYPGHCFARNQVIKNSSKKSKYIAFADADGAVHKDWLRTLVDAMESNAEDKIAGAGGPRYIHPGDSKRGQVVNAYLSKAGSGFSAAFSKKKSKYIESIANYNSIYKKDLLLTQPYDIRLNISDDVEINYRLRRLGYKFLYVPKAQIFHHETDSIRQFITNMKRYGDNVSRSMLKHKRPVRWYAVLVPAFILWVLIGAILSSTSTWVFTVYSITIIAYVLFIIGLGVVASIQYTSLRYFLHTILAPIQHVCYAYGVLRGLIKHRHMAQYKWDDNVTI